MSMLVILPFVSMGGLCLFFVRKGKLSPWNAPLVSACFITLAVYSFGLIGLMRVGLYGIMGTGIALGIYALWPAPRIRLHWSMALIAAGCALLWLRYRNAMLLQYDDFSHWGLIARHLLAHDALPDKQAVLIQFQSYPPAAACWIYAVCFFAGHSEGMMITAQAWFTLFALLPLFSIAEKNTVIKSGGIVVLMVIVLSMYHGTASLMVDNLLAAVSIGAVALTVHRRKSPAQIAWPLAAVLAVLCLVKDSGLYFAVLVFTLYGYFLRRGHHAAKEALPVLLLPAACRIVWRIHIKLAFSAAGVTRHAFTLQNMQAVSAGRSWVNFIQIGKAVVRAAASPWNQALQMLGLMVVGCVLVTGLRYVSTRRWRCAAGCRLLAGSMIAYGGYLALLVGMYFFTMPLHAAREAVAFERYNITFALFLYGLFAAYLLALPQASLPLKRLVPLVLALLLATPVAMPAYRCGFHRLLSETYCVPVREQLLALEQKRPLAAEESAALYVGDGGVQEDFVSYIAAYTFRQRIPIYTKDTLPKDMLPTVLYALQADDTVNALAKSRDVEVVVP